MLSCLVWHRSDAPPYRFYKGDSDQSKYISRSSSIYNGTFYPLVEDERCHCQLIASVIGDY